MLFALVSHWKLGEWLYKCFFVNVHYNHAPIEPYSRYVRSKLAWCQRRTAKLQRRKQWENNLDTMKTEETTKSQHCKPMHWCTVTGTQFAAAAGLRRLITKNVILSYLRSSVNILPYKRKGCSPNKELLRRDSWNLLAQKLAGIFACFHRIVKRHRIFFTDQILSTVKRALWLVERLSLWKRTFDQSPPWTALTGTYKHHGAHGYRLRPCPCGDSGCSLYRRRATDDLGRSITDPPVSQPAPQA